MSFNPKTLIFFIAISGLSLYISYNRDWKWTRRDYFTLSENARGLYTGKIKPVYNPLDAAYVISDKLEKLAASHTLNKYSQYKLWPVLSIMIDPKDLHDKERGILANPHKKGRLWERAVHVAYYKKGERIFESYAGIRLHGGASRRPEFKKKSFRLYFRDEYGKKSFPAGEGLTLVPNAKVKRMVLRLDKRYHFAHDFTFELTRRLGGMAPSIVPVAIFLNGEFYSYHFMTEHLDKDQIARDFKRDDFVFYKLKGDNETKDHLLYQRAVDRVRYSLAPLRFHEMQKHYDLKNMTASMTTILYTGLTDWAQGAVIKDPTRKNGKWKWIAWDYDNVFFIDRDRIEQPEVIHPWQTHSYKIALEFHQSSLRGRLFGRLIKESPEYQSFFFETINQLFDDALDPAWLNKKFSYYQSLIEEAQGPKKMIQDLERIKNFVKYRKPVFCAQTNEKFGNQPATCLDAK